MATAPEDRRAEIAGKLEGLVREYFDLTPEDAGTDCPLSVPLFGADEVLGAMEALLDLRLTMGDRVRAFEQAFADYVGTRHAVMVNSGSSANLLALSVLSAESLPRGLRPGDEVIVPAVTWSTTVAPILQAGCVPVFVDVDLGTLNLRADELETAWSPRTRAIMPVHLLGNPVDMGPLVEFAKERDLWVVEDSCEALGTRIGGRTAGGIGHLGTYSFFFSHHITTGEGGMVVTDDDRLVDIARSMRAHGWTREMSGRAEIEAANPAIDPRFLFAHIGYNLRPMETQAAFGLVQLKRLEELNRARRRCAVRLLDELGELDAELELAVEQEGGESSWFAFPVLTRDQDTRERLSRHLEERGIETRPIVAGNLTVHPAFRDSPHRKVGELANATAISERGLFVGIHAALDDHRLDHMIEGFRSFYRRA